MKKYLCVIGAIGGAFGIYKIGELVGAIKTGIYCLNLVEEVMPGTKKMIAKELSDRTIDAIFETKEETSEQEEGS